MKKNLQKAITVWITAAIVLVVGILCIVADNASASNASAAYEGISLVLGITLIVVSGLGLLLHILVQKRAASQETMANGIILAAGVYFVCQKYLAATLLSVLVEYVPYVLIVVGSLVALDAILILVFGIISKQEMKPVVIVFAVELAIAALAIVLGVLALPSVGVITAKFTILGIILIIYAVFLILSGLLTVLTTKKEEKPIEAEVTNVADVE